MASLQAGDTIPGNASTTAAINPSSSPATEFGWVNTAMDVDWFRMTVTAGSTYTIKLDGYSSTSGGGPALADPILRIHDASGQLIGEADDTLTSLTAAYTYQATSNGVIYLSAGSADGGTGRYALFVLQTATAAPDKVAGGVGTTASLAVGTEETGTLETSGDSDWYRVELKAGTLYAFGLDSQSSSSSLDPLLELYDASGRLLDINDDEEPGVVFDSRLTFMPTSDGTYFISAEDYASGTGDYVLRLQQASFGPILDTLDWRGRVSDNVVEVFFIPEGEEHEGYRSSGWTDQEIASVMAAFDTYAAVTPLKFVRVDSAAQATFRLMTTRDSDADFEGIFYAPGESLAGLGMFNRNGSGWSTTGSLGMQPGGFGFSTIVHEIGHGLGLAHPHDTGGGSSIMAGVNQEFDSLGAFGLNQGVFTTMSYNDGWPSQFGLPLSVYSGHQAGPMALDIAVLQSKYGANTTHRNGDDEYLLLAPGSDSTIFRSIWDTGGVDTIRSESGDWSVTIDLRAATLDYSPTGGGVLSFIEGARGGLTIAAGVVIENAIGSDGDDLIRGNAAANSLYGGEAADRLFGEEGDDLLLADRGNDLANGGPGADLINGGEFDDVIGGAEGSDLLGGASGEDLVFGDGGADQVFGDDGRDTVNGGDGDDLVNGGEGDDFIGGGTGFDFLGGGAGSDRMFGDEGRDFMLGDAGHDTIFGGDDDDVIFGIDGADQVLGNQGNDRLFGDEDNDFIAGGDGQDLINGGAGDDLVGGNARDDVLGGGDGADMIFGDDGGDLIFGDGGNDTVNGGTGNDNVNGGAGLDLVGGGEGDDLMGGGEDADALYGDAGDDTLYGDAGADTIVGGLGTDRLYGGGGADRFVFLSVLDSAPTARDRIFEFRADGADLIDLSAIDADAAASGDQAFRFVNAFTGEAGQVVLSYDGGAKVSTLQLDVNGDRAADFVLSIEGQADAAAFVL